MNEKEFVREIVTAFEEFGVPYFITGGMAAIAYGEPRFTNDVDIVADLRESNIPQILARFPGPDFYVSEIAVRQAVAKRFQFNILHTASGIKVDVILPSTSAYDRLRFARKKQLEIEADLRAFFAAPEDVILKKLEYYQIGGSEKHLRDIASMLLVRGDEIDRDYIVTWAASLGLAAEWQLVVDRLKDKGR